MFRRYHQSQEEQAIKLQKNDFLFFFLRVEENYYILFNQITRNRMKKENICLRWERIKEFSLRFNYF